MVSVQFSSVTQLCPTLCDPMNHSTPGFPFHHHLPEFTQTHVHRVGDAIQPPHSLSSPLPPAPIPPSIRVFSNESTLCMKCSLGISNFLEEISSLSHSIVFLYFFSLITEEGFLISPCYSLKLCIQMGVSFLFSFAFHFPSFVLFPSPLLFYCRSQ